MSIRPYSGHFLSRQHPGTARRLHAATTWPLFVGDLAPTKSGQRGKKDGFSAELEVQISPLDLNQSESESGAVLHTRVAVCHTASARLAELVLTTAYACVAHG